MLDRFLHDIRPNSVIVEKKKCAACGQSIDSKLFLESKGDYFHEECWIKTTRERLGPLVKSKMEQLATAIREHGRYLKKFLLFTAIINGLFILELAFFQVSDLGLLILTFVTLCALLAAPFQIVHVLREIRKNKKEIQKLESESLF